MNFMNENRIAKELQFEEIFVTSSFAIILGILRLGNS